MQFDSQAQKAFVIECFKKYSGSKEDRLTIEQALGYINAYSTALTAGTIIIEDNDGKHSPVDSGAGAPEDNIS